MARELGVATNTVTHWISRYEATTIPFPESDITIDDGAGVTRGWLPERLPELKQWATVERHKALPIDS